MHFQSYQVDGCENKEIFHRFLRAILACSDAFSLIFFRYKEEEKPSEGVSGMEKELAPYMADSREVTQWPGTKLRNEQGHIYRMVTYRIDMGLIPILEKIDRLWDWDYPRYPMDPCFYKNGYAWFAVSSHERWNALYLRDDIDIPEDDDQAAIGRAFFPSVLDLESLGVVLTPGERVPASELFFHEHYSWNR